jgi:hypothetical protein
MSYIPYCRASQALSIGIWFNLSSGKIWRKILPIWIRYDTWFHPKRQNSNMIISSAERCSAMCNVWFDAQLNGLQNGVKFFFGNLFLTSVFGQNTEKKREIVYAKKTLFFDFLPSISRLRRNVLYTVL